MSASFSPPIRFAHSSRKDRRVFGFSFLLFAETPKSKMTQPLGNKMSASDFAIKELMAFVASAA
jgi:hypothetical protein